jgi:outer membrane protein, multidrug efflux system
VKKFFLTISVLFMLVGGSGCRWFEPAARNLAGDVLPDRFSVYTGAADCAERWWERFEDPELNRLVNLALAQNHSLQEAWARLNQARAVAVQAGADRFPSVTASADGFTGRRQTAESAETKMRNGIEGYSLSVLTSYELDFWGRIASGQKAARRKADAAFADFQTAAVTLSAAVTERWILLLSQRMQQELLARQLEVNHTLQELVDLRFQQSIVSALDVYQQQQIVEKVKAAIPLVIQEKDLLLHELAVLTGQPPKTPLTVTRQQMPDPGPLPSTGLPADLLANRPDIRAAAMRVDAADWQVAAARADRLPSITISARGQFGESRLDMLFENWLLRLAGGMVAPILDGARRAAEVERVRAVVDENLAAYGDTVLTALREVEDALTRESTLQQHIEGLERVTEAARRALRQAGVRYRSGLNDYLPVLNQLLAVQELERELIRRKADRLVARVQIYRALGGRWPEMTAPMETSRKTR